MYQEKYLKWDGVMEPISVDEGSTSELSAEDTKNRLLELKELKDDTLEDASKELKSSSVKKERVISETPGSQNTKNTAE